MFGPVAANVESQVGIMIQRTSRYVAIAHGALKGVWRGNVPYVVCNSGHEVRFGCSCAAPLR